MIIDIDNDDDCEYDDEDSDVADDENYQNNL